jgi:hypothetical protein
MIGPSCFQHYCVASYHTIFPVQILNVKGELTTPNDLVVESVPLRQCCKLRTRKFSDRTEPEAVNGQPKTVGPEYRTSRSQ